MTQPITQSRAVDPDPELVRAAKAGSYEAFEQLVDKYERPIYTTAMRIVRRPEDAEEVVQETFLSVVRHLKGFREDSSFHTWLVRIATNHALKILRKKRGLSTVPLDRPQDDDETPLPHPSFIAQWKDDPIDIASRREVRALLEDAMGHLEEKYRLVFILRDVEGLSTEETADLLGISVPNDKVRLLRARLMLREQLTQKLGDEATRVRPHEH